MTEEFSSKLNDLLESNQNKFTVKCSRCGSIILMPLTAVYVNETNDMPTMHSKTDDKSINNNESSEFPFEKLSGFWKVSDMYSFENIGFSNLCDNKKYLLCADCEIGPVGFQDLSRPNNFLIAIDRVEHV